MGILAQPALLVPRVILALPGPAVHLALLATLVPAGLLGKLVRRATPEIAAPQDRVAPQGKLVLSGTLEKLAP